MLQASFYSTALKTLISVSTVILLGLIFAYHALEVQVRIKTNKKKKQKKKRNPISSMLQSLQRACEQFLLVDVASAERAWKNATRYKTAFVHTCGVSFQKPERASTVFRNGRNVSIIFQHFISATFAVFIRVFSTLQIFIQTKLKRTTYLYRKRILHARIDRSRTAILCFVFSLTIVGFFQFFVSLIGILVFNKIAKKSKSKRN